MNKAPLCLPNFRLRLTAMLYQLTTGLVFSAMGVYSEKSVHPRDNSHVQIFANLFAIFDIFMVFHPIYTQKISVLDGKSMKIQKNIKHKFYFI